MTVVDSNGKVTEEMNGEDRSTADSHSTPASTEAPVDKEVDEVTDMFKGLSKKKKSSTKKKDDAPAEEAVTADGEFDPSALKKKKKKKTTTEKKDDDFEARLAEAGVGDEATEKAPAASEGTAQDGDFEKGTGIFQHDAATPIGYPLLLSRFFTILSSHHPDILSNGSKSYKIPPPQCLREGNKKTIFANLAEICKRMKRSDEHVIQFLFAELGTTGSVDGSKRLVIRGKFQQKQIENVLRRYIVEYVTCKTCRSPDTELTKGENRLYFVQCRSCESRRSVTAIKAGFSAQVGKRKRAQG